MKTLSKITGHKDGVMREIEGLNYLLPRQTESAGHTTHGRNSQITGDISTQINNVETNNGVTGITGTGHTINVYQYPKELTELLTRLIKNG